MFAWKLKVAMKFHIQERPFTLSPESIRET